MARPLRWLAAHNRETSIVATTTRAARLDDLPVIAALHGRGLPDGFFARLGPRFLVVYHRGFVEGPDAVALVTERDGQLTGVVVGSARPGAHSRWVVRQHGLRLAAAGVGALLVRPSLLLEFVRTRAGRYLRGVWRRVRPAGRTPSAGGADGPAPRDAAYLAHVVVATSARGEGAGAVLVNDFVEEVRRTGAAQVALVTKAHGGAGRFYDGLGWTRYREVATSDGTIMAEYTLDLT